jgi:hypothetical protein
LKPYICLYFKSKWIKKTEEFYDRLKVELDLNNTWPAEYLFKFIVPSDATNIEKLQTAFDCMECCYKNKKSKTGKFTKHIY